MFHEPHYPSKWSVAIVFIVILFLMVAVFVWAFYLNIGTIVFKSDDSFQMTFSGEVYPCDDFTCEFSLSPGDYSFLASREGYFDQDLSFRVDRFKTTNVDLDFVLVPYLKPIDSLPLSGNHDYDLRATGNGYEFFSKKDGVVLSSFETLSSPELKLVDGSAFILDNGRLFIVDLQTGRKQRRFDDSVFIRYVLPNTNAERSFLFVTYEGSDQLWLYKHITDKLVVLQWNVTPSLLQWAPGSSNVIYVITDQFNDDDTSLFSNLLTKSNISSPDLALYQYNIDTDEFSVISSFSGKDIPIHLDRIQDRYFISYKSGKLDELMLDR